MDKFSIHRVPLHPSIRSTQPKPINTQQSFKAHLQEASKQELKVSKHANERIIERKINITEHEWQVVSDKVFEAHSKGVKQPLVLMDQAALIVSAKNATVITAMDRTEAKQQLFTNIDGTIVL
ncbi:MULTISPECIES: TIGR02530 family flagellar biosynthesis protein [Lysinibacillus]|uniref:TIGR02530 family flagellar biosynthesis protein n=1 Tax=Lysinibacillus capsici TaxID=2115968 RepID=A0ABY8KIT6_9BACI|nr:MULTISPECIES: TIGR02530 family flagellar biosynthesis protein [Lysinibacillus]MDP1393073.1 TIGR02530 family flagellar biosynthesis protein [Lysinibacillus capsici]MDP1413547.1 TIGR02530 family flagellar biosynthesis protein [Lysinibacillus capsici]MDP1429516.1 TIGR02530 family flagellar biosynthesis protein [Lysinibacillus capsici]WGF38029.1 TIGR02530 family flagellar biosynthesis protein [Lysinibacillus capsici]